MHILQMHSLPIHYFANKLRFLRKSQIKHVLRALDHVKHEFLSKSENVGALATSPNDEKKALPKK